MLRFACTGARPEPFAAGPSLLFDLRIATPPDVACTRSRCAPRSGSSRGSRKYTPEEQARLVDLFGEPARWGETLNPLQLATVATTVAGFTDEITATVTVPLTYDLDIAATKFCHGLRRRRDPAAPAVRGHRVLPGRRRRAGRAGAVERGGDVPAAGGHLARGHGRPLPRLHASSGCPPATLDALSAYRSKHVITTWDDDAWKRLLKESRGVRR